MRVLILSHFYDPEPIPKPSDLALELSRRGHIVSVITGFPNYPSGRLYRGFRLRLMRREIRSGILVLRMLVWPSHGRSRLGRVMNYVSAMMSSIFGAFISPPCDVIYVFHPPLTIGVAAWIIGRLKRARFVYDIQDIWPESLVLSGMLSNRLIIGLLHHLEQFVYRRARALLVVTDGARRNLIEKKVAEEKISVMPHWADESFFLQVSPEDVSRIRERLGLGDRLVIMYAGNMGLLQGLDTTLEAARLLQDDKRIVFVLVGDGTDRGHLIQMAEALKLRNIVFVAHQPVSAMPAFLACADALLVLLKRSAVSEFVIPTKTIAYLASGRPIIVAMDGPAAELVRNVGAGVAVPPEDAQALAGAVRRLAQLSPEERTALGEAGRLYARAHCAKPKVIDAYERVLMEAAGGTRGPVCTSS